MDERLRRLDAWVGRQDWRILLVTRLVPLFSSNLQNYAYGLTRIRLFTYVLVSAICMVPSTVEYYFAGGSIPSVDLTRPFVYLAITAVFFVNLSP